MQSVKVFCYVSSGTQSQDHDALASVTKHSSQRQHRHRTRCWHHVATNCVYAAADVRDDLVRFVTASVMGVTC